MLFRPPVDCPIGDGTISAARIWVAGIGTRRGCPARAPEAGPDRGLGRQLAPVLRDDDPLLQPAQRVAHLLPPGARWCSTTIFAIVGESSGLQHEGDTMTIQIPPQLEERIRGKLATGRYHDAIDVLSEALLALDEHEQREGLRAALDVGDEQIARGEYEPWTPTLRAAIAHEARQLAREGHEPSSDVRP